VTCGERERERIIVGNVLDIEGLGCLRELVINAVKSVTLFYFLNQCDTDKDGVPNG